MITTKKMSKKITTTYFDLIILLVLMILFGLISVSRGQDANWDLCNYHYYNAYAFLTGRLTQDIAPSFIQTYFNPLLDTFNYLLIHAIKVPEFIAFIMGSFSGIAVFFLIKIATLLFYSESQWHRICYIISSTVIGVTGAASRSQLGTFMNEYEISIFIISALYCILIGLYFQKNIRKQYSYLLLAGILLGLASGLKLTAIIYASALFITTALSLKKFFIVRIKLLTALFCGLIFGFGITEGFWMIKLYHLFGNPLFPYYNNIFHSHYAKIVDYADRRFLPKSLLQYFFYPFYWLKKNSLTAEISFRDIRFAAVLFFSFLYLLLNLHRWVKQKSTTIFADAQQKHIAHFIFLFWMIAYVLWLTKFSIMRYTIPLEMTAGLLITYFCITLFKTNRTRMIILFITTIMTLWTTQAPNWVHVPFQHSFIQIEGIPKALPKKSLIILMTGDEHPMAYMIPHFPAATIFVRVQYPHTEQLNTARAYRAIFNYHGPIYSLSDPTINTKAYLAPTRLQTMDETCLSIKSNLDQTPMMLCQLKK